MMTDQDEFNVVTKIYNDRIKMYEEISFETNEINLEITRQIKGLELLKKQITEIDAVGLSMKRTKLLQDLLRYQLATFDRNVGT